MYKIYIDYKRDSKKHLEEILKEYHITYDIFYNEYGKPYIKNNPIYFNISHSGDYIVVIVSDRECGIDIEKIRPIKKSIIDKVCLDSEKELICDDKSFTLMWTKKEAYSKYTGLGYAYGFKNIDTTKILINTIYFLDYIISFYYDLC